MPIEIKEIVIKAKVEMSEKTSRARYNRSSEIKPQLTNMQELVDEAMRAVQQQKER